MVFGSFLPNQIEKTNKKQQQKHTKNKKKKTKKKTKQKTKQKKKKKKITSKFGPLWQNFLDPCMIKKTIKVKQPAPSFQVKCL